ncbi:triphosphoribosyl-dephospho-CoA synthase CitG [Ligilactobacillus sp. WILCCON 0076]|uniref:Probable 2-(5''-triphosphoribosyl)-3'-dephosphocoenzyme-A synthase n=1 Tax=Ligilactobacillus ubinensis TaxID=2876789 RepID=A0A9X2FIP3_9LACO|nr:triphosphoribosyl-dephospho-CoA synthase CitG [Ligilactobacillus ubinensis]MCP0886594.1 triphosphoribosyl-dephospho-CoA synthase CitG [Ligilactobacillus ubinensis]
MEIFSNGRVVSLDEVLQNKEWRQNYQETIETKYPNKVVLGIKLNIPGPIKTNASLKKVFELGWNKIINSLKDKKLEIFFFNLFLDKITGPEGVVVVSGDIIPVKKEMITFESNFLLGRLFDIDVMSKTDKNYQLSRTQLGFEARKCLICEQDAKICAKTQKHTLAEIYREIEKLIEKYMKQDIKNVKIKTVDAALAALLYEVTVNPKPGLVDPISNGSHLDMDVFTFIDSSQALRPYFSAAYDLAVNFKEKDLTQLFNELRKLGMIAEKDMYAATNGINTHKGAIFSLGIFLTAVAYLKKQQNYSIMALQQTIKKMLSELLEDDFKSINMKNNGELTAGEQQFLKYKTRGIRGEAVDGYPVVFNYGLSYLKASTGSLNQRLLDTFMYIAEHTSDSNLIKRAHSVAILTEMKNFTAHYFKLGGSKTKEGIEYLYKLDKLFIERNLSLGGSADLLILTIFVAKIEGVI